MTTAFIIGHLIFDVIAACVIYVLHNHAMDRLRNVLTEMAGDNHKLVRIIKHQFGHRQLRKAGFDPARLDQYQTWLKDPRPKR